MDKYDYLIAIEWATDHCWVDLSIDGDPGRTFRKGNATRFATENEAKETEAALRRKYPKRRFKIQKTEPIQ